ncbi:helix-turn-helix domain-containing protein [Archaeoglobus sp.]
MKKCNPSSCLLACVLGLNCAEAETYFALLEKGNADVDDIAKAINKDKTTVYRALRRLEEIGLVSKEYRIVRTGGYKYIYKPIPVKDLESLVIRRVEEILREFKNLTAKTIET